MALLDDLKSDVGQIFRSVWTTRDGTTVPSNTDLKLGNDAVKLQAAVLYADLDDSTKMVDQFIPDFAAEIYKAYLHCTAKIISQAGGEITAYDGDRIMAVFLGDRKNTHAVRTALKLNYMRIELLNPAIKECYPKVDFQVQHVVGIDAGDLFVARTGIRGANDLVWVGHPANYAAKLTTISEGYSTWITEIVYKNMTDVTRYGGTDNKNMWEERTWANMGGMKIYRSNWTWRID
jgi:class 3 adenylate cyclase